MGPTTKKSEYGKTPIHLFLVMLQKGSMMCECVILDQMGNSLAATSQTAIDYELGQAIAIRYAKFAKDQQYQKGSLHQIV